MILKFQLCTFRSFLRNRVTFPCYRTSSNTMRPLFSVDYERNDFPYSYFSASRWSKIIKCLLIDLIVCVFVCTDCFNRSNTVLFSQIIKWVLNIMRLPPSNYFSSCTKFEEIRYTYRCTYILARKLCRKYALLWYSQEKCNLC